ncbi:MAG: LLM class flavin-dependent oxidoreductase [Acidobacteria bacterium]|nr:LLM class flavin-dependent oxidoreductase [Acidobacteriota bacterium]
MRLAMYLQDDYPIREAIDYVRYAEDRGFEAVWQAESRLVREATVPMAAFLAHTARIKIVPGGELQPGTVEVHATSSELGSNEAIVDANIDGEEMEIAFNVRYLIDVLSVIDAPNVELNTNTSTSPGLIRPVGREDFIHVIMPMRLN